MLHPTLAGGGGQIPRLLKYSPASWYSIPGFHTGFFAWGGRQQNVRLEASLLDLILGGW